MKRHRMTVGATVFVAALFMLTLGVPSASADTFDYVLDVGNSAISGATGPYGTVDVNLNTTTNTATITFNAASGFKLGDSGPGEQGFGVNVNAASWTVSSVLPPSYSNSGAGALDGTGSYNQTFYDNGGFPASVTTFSFQITDTAGTWASASQVLSAASGGTLGNFAVAAHVFVCTDPSCAAASATGYAGGDPSSVPDGGMTVMLLGGALLGLETLRRRFSA